MLNLKQEALDLIADLKYGTIQPTAYDTAWMASVPLEDSPHRPRYPQALEWLTRHQHPDGSWGGEIEYFSDRVICTLAALLAFARMGKRQEDRERMEAGIKYLWKNLRRVKEDPSELVGAELILPSLFCKAGELGINLPNDAYLFEDEREEKLRLIPGGLPYPRTHTVVHSLEFLGDSVDVGLLKKSQSPNGSFGNSPAATAYFLSLADDPLATDYLRRAQSSESSGGVPTLYPWENFEHLWVLYNFHKAGLSLAEIMDDIGWQGLLYQMGEGGMTMSRTFYAPDGDITAVAIRLLSAVGYQLDPKVLTNFEMDEHFAAFVIERHASNSVNIHVLDALKSLPHYPNRHQAMGKILDFLEANQVDKMYWFDKWHISPYYTTTQAIMAAIGLPEEWAKRAKTMIKGPVDWLLNTQNPDGSWGYKVGTVEETSYAIQALLLYRSRVSSFSPEVLRRGANWLYENYSQMEYPELWIGKCLYAPVNIIRSAAISALALYNANFARRVGDIRMI
ncbi:MAG: hypothetical protein HY664_02205 [Chloroflexi bacterium]|nr:hypothetical protein [Chloroflexota bacterium]